MYMTESGRVKWYGGTNRKTGKENDYGYIEADFGGDVRVDLKDFLYPNTVLYQDQIVIFERRDNESRSAKRVRTLQQELDATSLRFQQGDIEVEEVDRVLRESAQVVGYSAIGDWLLGSSARAVLKSGMLDEIVPRLPIEKQLEIHLARLVLGNDVNVYEVCIALMLKVPPEKWGKQIPLALLRDRRLLPYQSPADSVEILWGEIRDAAAFRNLWRQLSWKVQIVACYRAAYERVRLPVEEGDTNDERSRAVLRLASRALEQRSGVRAGLLEDFDSDIHCYLNRVFYEPVEVIDLGPILPPCPQHKVSYCEGRIWKGANAIFCPRLGKACDHGSHVYPQAASWTEWTLAELLQSIQIGPQVANSRPREYVTQLGGHINRAQEIREHLRCRVCDDVLFSDKRYAERLAVYNATVFGCRKGCENNVGVYLSHCWGCANSVIDARDNTVMVGGFRLCLRCGTGPDPKNRPTTFGYYRQGDICPRCGVLADQDNSDMKHVVCQNCGHSINLPPSTSMTGINDWEQRRMKLASLGFSPSISSREP